MGSLIKLIEYDYSLYDLCDFDAYCIDDLCRHLSNNELIEAVIAYSNDDVYYSSLYNYIKAEFKDSFDDYGHTLMYYESRYYIDRIGDDMDYIISKMRPYVNLCAEYCNHLSCYRVYDPLYPSRTVAYEDDLEQIKKHADQYGYYGVNVL